MKRRERVTLLVAVLPIALAVTPAAAAVRCAPDQQDIATSLLEEARRAETDLDRALLLKRSLKVCESASGWLELGRAEHGLDNHADAAYAFENARDRLASSDDGTLGRAKAEQLAIANAWLAESYARDDEIALAIVSVQEARRGFDAIGKSVPDRLVRLQAELDDAMAEADESVMARSFELQHERTTRGIGLVPRVTAEPDSSELMAETETLAAAYAGTDAPPAPSTPTPATPTTVPEASVANESRMSIPVLFGFDSAVLAPESERTVTRLGAALARLDLTTSDLVRIIGHTDSQGDAAYNRTLSERRANAVLGKLRTMGSTSARLEASGLGESELRYTGTTPDDHRRNRRVELVVIR